LLEVKEVKMLVVTKFYIGTVFACYFRSLNNGEGLLQHLYGSYWYVRYVCTYRYLPTVPYRTQVLYLPTYKLFCLAKIKEKYGRTRSSFL